jgi:hypothetical protein
VTPNKKTLHYTGMNCIDSVPKSSTDIRSCNRQSNFINYTGCNQLENKLIIKGTFTFIIVALRFYFGSLSDPIAHFRALQVLVSLEQLNRN